MAGFVLKVKTKSGQRVVNGLIPQDRVGQLKDKLAEVTGIPVHRLHVLGGFPPRTIDLQDDDSTIEASGIVSGDTLIVEERQVQQVCNGERVDADEDIARSHIVDEESFGDRPGLLMKKVVPADNSCLFTSVGYVLKGQVDPGCSGYMRKIIANAVAADKDEYSEAILGRPNAEYCDWILKPDSWGGAIELSILSKFYGLEIAVIDSINGIINRFGEDQHYAQRVFLIFDGIHYDPLYLEPLDVRTTRILLFLSPGGRIQTIFPSDDERVLSEAGQLAKEVKSSRQFTDVQKLALMCNDCKIKLNGHIAARNHAKDTGHTNFGEVDA